MIQPSRSTAARALLTVPRPGSRPCARHLHPGAHHHRPCHRPRLHCLIRLHRLRRHRPPPRRGHHGHRLYRAGRRPHTPWRPHRRVTPRGRDGSGRVQPRALVPSPGAPGRPGQAGLVSGDEVLAEGGQLGVGTPHGGETVVGAVGHRVGRVAIRVGEQTVDAQSGIAVLGDILSAAPGQPPQRHGGRGKGSPGPRGSSIRPARDSRSGDGASPNRVSARSSRVNGTRITGARLAASPGPDRGLSALPEWIASLVSTVR